KLSLKKKNEELNAKVLPLEKDQEFYKEMILTANRKVERLEQHDWCEMGENQNAMAIECLADDELLSQAHPEKANVSNLVRLVANTNNLLAEEVYADIQSVVGGFDVCIFAYGQTDGPLCIRGVSEEEWGVNHQALNDIFQLYEDRRHSFKYVIQVQFYEIYNEKLQGQAKTLMFVHINPTSFSETMSSLRVAESVSCVELGTARSNKEKREGEGEREGLKSSWNMYNFLSNFTYHCISFWPVYKRLQLFLGGDNVGNFIKARESCTISIRPGAGNTYSNQR
ncbi:kinesin-4-like isoform X1, partial [Tanacetum coccineum]